MSQVGAAKQRTSIACTSCRSKRIRCNGGLPSCQACVISGRTCDYPYEQEKRKPPSKQYVQALLARIDILERELAQHHSTTDKKAAESEEAVTSQIIPSSVLSETTDPVGDLTDLLGHLNVADDGYITYFGPRSNFIISRQGIPKALVSSPRLVELSSDAPKLRTGLTAELQNELLDLFWTWQNPWNYFVHKKRFLEELEGGAKTYCTELLLLTVLSVATRYTDSVEVRSDVLDPTTAGNELADRAKQILLHEMETPSVSTVAAACLLAMREMAVDKDSLGWTYTGIASRIAFNLGLHLDCSHLVNSGQLSAEDAEIRNMTWWAYYILDKLFNVGLGRPSGASHRDISAAFPSYLPDVEYGLWSPVPNNPKIPPQPSRLVSSVRHVCEIFLISSEALDDICAPNSRLTRSERENIASETYVKLATFYNNLPSFLRLPQSANKPLPPHVYLMHIQYYTAIIQLHRPFIRRRSSSPFEDLLSPSVYFHNQACSAAAESITNIIRAYRINYTLRRVAISTTHGLGSSAVIHLFNATSNDPLMQKKALRLLKYNFNCLQEMSIAFLWSKRMLRILQILAQQWKVEEALQNNSMAASQKDQLDGALPEKSENEPASGIHPQTASTKREAPFVADMDWLLSYDPGDGWDGGMGPEIFMDLGPWDFTQSQSFNYG